MEYKVNRALVGVNAFGAPFNPSQLFGFNLLAIPIRHLSQANKLLLGELVRDRQRAKIARKPLIKSRRREVARAKVLY
jgi:hypothetical protein